jgi:hypothetical protein
VNWGGFQLRGRRTKGEQSSNPGRSARGGSLRSLAAHEVDPGQAWFWTLDWLSGELEADREAPSDPGAIYDDAESFKTALHAAHSE